jgi:hypothetical protein
VLGVLVLNRLSAEGFGKFWLVFGGCGNAVIGAALGALIWAGLLGRD